LATRAKPCSLSSACCRALSSRAWRRGTRTSCHGREAGMTNTLSTTTTRWGRVGQYIRIQLLEFIRTRLRVASDQSAGSSCRTGYGPVEASRRRHAGALGAGFNCIEAAQEDHPPSVTPRLQTGIDGIARVAWPARITDTNNPIPWRSRLLNVGQPACRCRRIGPGINRARLSRELTTDGRSPDWRRRSLKIQLTADT
jgi:hypothetical protein